MAYRKRPLEELNILDDFLMNALAGDPEVGEEFCREILSVLLQRRIGQVRIVTQRTLPAAAPDLRGIRMDVEVEEKVPNAQENLPSMNVYDLEPHLYQSGDIFKHNRFYQAKIDSRYLPAGTFRFSGMPDLYVITILNYDPFGCDRMMYQVYNQCREEPELEYKDGLRFIYFFTDGRKGRSKEIGALLAYMKNSRQENAVDETTRKLHTLVERVKMKPEVKIGYMRFDEIIAYERKEEREETTKEIRIQSICELLEEYGAVPPELKSRLEENTDDGVFSRWHKLAARSGSIAAFMAQM